MKNPDSRIEILRGDITKLEVDAIVNAANTTLLGGGGVDGAIHRAAGPELLAECRTLGGCEPGQAKITRAYRLLARFVIHTVGPIWRGGKHDEARTLANCYRNSLHLAVENEIKTIAFPAISCGAYGYPIEEAAHIAFKTTREFLAVSDEIRKVIFVVWGEDIYDTYRRLL
jgi:O-acetyl-ADP-ribose deacetylase